MNADVMNKAQGELYREYINSAAWKKKREERLGIDGYKCFICGSDKNLHVHHLTYDRLGCEDAENDLITLCKHCHFELWHKSRNDVEMFIQEQERKTIQRINESIQKIREEHEKECSEYAASRLADLFGKNKISGNGEFCRIIRAFKDSFGRNCNEGTIINRDRALSFPLRDLPNRIAKYRRDRGYTK